MELAKQVHDRKQSDEVRGLPVLKDESEFSSVIPHGEILTKLAKKLCISTIDLTRASNMDTL
jgi:hypothetical protein